MALFLVFYLDSVRFFNFKKTVLSLRKPVELVEFEKVACAILPDNALKSRLELISGKPYIKMDGYQEILIDPKNSLVLRRKSLHPSTNLALFSMGYASEYLLDHYHNKTLGKNEVEILETIYEFIYNEIINPFSLNSISVNDHVVSERIQFIVLFYSYVKDNYPDKKHLLNHLSKDFNICFGFLCDDRFFTWQTNHGVMQIRSLAQLTDIIKDKELTGQIKEIVDKRLSDILPYFIGTDGAIYESASGYWVFLYDQFKKLTEIDAIKDLSSVVKIENKLSLANDFIYTVASNDGYLHGLGDSYSRYLNSPLSESKINKDRIFRYSNEIAGASWTQKNNYFNILFSSLNTPPNVHKLPDDLALYLYINEPFFVGTGKYSYDTSAERAYFETEHAQSTVIFESQTQTAPDSSQVRIKNIGFNTLTLSGTKYYKNGQEIKRSVHINSGKGIEIIDSADSRKLLVTYFNLHPDVKIRYNGSKELVLISKDSISIKISSDKMINIIDGVYSDKPQHLQPIKRLEIKGNPINTDIVFPELKEIIPLNLVTGTLVISDRQKIARELSYIYSKAAENGSKENIINKAIKLMIFLLVIVLASEGVSLAKRKYGK